MRDPDASVACLCSQHRAEGLGDDEHVLGDRTEPMPLSLFLEWLIDVCVYRSRLLVDSLCS